MFMEPSPLLSSLFGAGKQVFFRLQKETLGHQPNHETLDLQPVLPGRCAVATVAQNLWEWTTDIWFNLSPMSRE